jgi:hypothetical protein
MSPSDEVVELPNLWGEVADFERLLIHILLDDAAAESHLDAPVGEALPANRPLWVPLHMNQGALKLHPPII